MHPVSARTLSIFDALGPLSVVFPVDDALIEEEAGFLSSLCGGPRASFLDFGCGLAQLAAALARRGFRVVGYEPSEGMRNQALHFLAQARGGRRVVLMHLLEPLIAARQHFNVVFARSVFPHLLSEKERVQALTAMSSLTKVGGRCVFDLRLASAMTEQAEHMKASRDRGFDRVELLVARTRLGPRRFVNKLRVVERDQLGREITDTRFSIPIRGDAESYAEHLCNLCGLRIMGIQGGYAGDARLDTPTRVIIATPV